MIVVDTPDALLVTSKESVDQIKSLVSDMASANRAEGHIHRKVYAKTSR